MSEKISQKDICKYYFGLEPINMEQNVWKCICKTTRKCDVKKSGYGNLFSHIKNAHPDFNQKVKQFEQSKKVTPSSQESTSSASSANFEAFFDKKAMNIYRWLEWIIIDEHDLSFVEKNLTRKNTNLEPISVKTIKKYMFQLVNAVENKITEIVNAAPAYCLIFDGWTEGSQHFIGLFISCPGKEESSTPHLFLLAFAPLPDETTFNAANHKDFINMTLEHHKIDRSKLFCLVGDNCNVNKAVADLMGVPLIGCRSHRLNIAVKAYLDENLFGLVDLVQNLMNKLSALKASGRLRLLTALRPRTKNETRWTGVVTMFERYFKLKDSISKMNDEIVDLMPSARQEKDINTHMNNLVNLKKVTLEHQQKHVTLVKSDAMFQYIIETIPQFDFKKYLSTDARIVHSANLEKALIKIQGNEEGTLTNDETNTVTFLKKSHEDASSTSSQDFIQQAYKKRKLDEENKETTYINTSFILPTSNDVERLNSLAKRIFSPKRRSLKPQTLEALVFLKVNADLWDYNLVVNMMKEKDIIVFDDSSDSDSVSD